MERYDRIFSFIWITLGVVQCIESVVLGLGSVSEPATGFMPFIMGIVLILLAGFLFIEASVELKKKPGLRVSVWADVYWKRVVYIVLLMTGYAVLLPKLGFLVGTLLVMVFLMKSGESVKWPVAILIGLATAFISYMIFGVWLKVSFPRGILSF
jgi:hypothetical protein